MYGFFFNYDMSEKSGHPYECDLHYANVFEPCQYSPVVTVEHIMNLFIYDDIINSRQKKAHIFNGVKLKIRLNRQYIIVVHKIIVMQLDQALTAF